MTRLSPIILPIILAARIFKSKSFILLFAVISFGTPKSTLASCDVGLEVTAGKFSLKIVYQCLVDKPDEGIRYMQDSSGLLFDVVAFFQKHYSELSKIDRNYRVDILLPDDEGDSTAKELIISWEDAKTGPDGAIKTIPFKELTVDTFRNHICSFIPVSNCTLGQDDASFMYKRKKNFKIPFPDSILFGSFPSDSMIRRYVLRPPAGKETDFRKLSISRKEMKKYFGILE